MHRAFESCKSQGRTFMTEFEMVPFLGSRSTIFLTLQPAWLHL